MNDDADILASVFACALPLQTPDERSAYLDQACAGNAALRDRVESLLHADERAGDFLLQQPQWLRPPDGPHLTEGPGTRIGWYRLVEEIGAGAWEWFIWPSRNGRSVAKWPSRSSDRVQPKTVGADKGYDAGEFFGELELLGIEPHIPLVKWWANRRRRRTKTGKRVWNRGSGCRHA